MSVTTALPVATAFAPASALGALTAERFAQTFAAQAGAPAWWLARKQAAYDRAATLPIPRRTDESWRFSSLAGLSAAAPQIVAAPSANPLSELRTAGRLHFANNRLATRSALPADLVARGVLLTTLTEAAQRHPELLKAHFMAQPQRLGSEKLAALHTAFVGEGAFLYIPRGVEISDPILIVHAAEGSPVFPHTLVVAEENTQATVIDFFTGATPLALGANDLYAGHGSQLTYVAVQDWAHQALSFQLNSTVVRRDARVQSLNVHLGARQARHESLSQLQAPGAFSEMLAVTVADEAQEFDQRTLQVHQAPNTKSDLLYKNVLLDQAKTIFSGLIIVDPDAQKTDAYQSNRNLVLGEGAEANSLPGLEIQANDVRCTHGATTSRIDPEQEFYLQARGIRPAQARNLLVFAFFEEVLNRLTHEELHAALRALIQAKFKS